MKKIFFKYVKLEVDERDMKNKAKDISWSMMLSVVVIAMFLAIVTIEARTPAIRLLAPAMMIGMLGYLAYMFYTALSLWHSEIPEKKKDKE